MTSVKGKRRRVIAQAALAGALALGGLAGTTAPASAFFFGPWFGDAPIYRDAVIPPRFVATILRGQGFRLAEPPVRRGPTIVALGVDDRGQLARFVIDAYEGGVIRMSLVGAPRPPGFIGPNRAYASVPPEAVERDLAEPPPLPKPKHKTKTAARTPSPLPHAAPASPHPTPSQATKAPVAPVKPAAAPVAAKPTDRAPTGSTPAATASAPKTPAAPETRLAPDAQPKDIGPKVVPVKPAEARGADVPPPPADWDTEAAPKTVTPDQANTMAPERYKDGQN